MDPIDRRCVWTGNLPERVSLRGTSCRRRGCTTSPGFSVLLLPRLLHGRDKVLESFHLAQIGFSCCVSRWGTDGRAAHQLAGSRSVGYISSSHAGRATRGDSYCLGFPAIKPRSRNENAATPELLNGNERLGT
jgi:hypothetical protein